MVVGVRCSPPSPLVVAIAVVVMLLAAKGVTCYKCMFVNEFLLVAPVVAGRVTEAFVEAFECVRTSFYHTLVAQAVSA